MKRDVFISYSRRNIERVKEIKSEIDAQCGTDCWIDLQGIESGSEMFLRDIVGGIDACKVFLFMLSRESMESEYALLELNYAKEQGKRVVLVNIDDCHMTGVFLFKYSLTDTIAWNNPPQHDKLLRDVKRWVGEQAEQVSQAEQLAVEQQRKDEAERKAKAEEERKKQEEAERRAKEEAERKAKAEEERKRREEAERRAKEEAERKAREEAARKAKAEEERKKQEEAESKYIVVGTGEKVVDIVKDIPKGATHIRIANGVVEIRSPYLDYTFFAGNNRIVSVTIPNSVKRIGDFAFRDCGLTSINIPNSVAAIGSGAFCFCRGLTSINIPNSVTAIDGNAFSGCTGLTSINIPDSVTAIGGYAFEGCRGLTAISIPRSVKTIGQRAFSGCDHLERASIYVRTKYDKTTFPEHTKITKRWLG